MRSVYRLAAADWDEEVEGKEENKLVTAIDFVRTSLDASLDIVEKIFLI